MIKGVAALILALTVAAVAGCGGSSDPETLTKAAFVKQGNKICAEATQARQKVIAEVVEATNPKGNQEAAQLEVIQKGIPTYEKAAEQIGELGAPKGEEKQVEALVEAMEEAAKRAKADPHTAVISNVPFRKADKIAQETGLKECVV